MPKVVVIGFDGATWNLLKPWAEEGKLPTLAKLMREGVWGNLRTTHPAVTSPAWKCYSTGKNPGKLGVFEWFVFDAGATTIKAANSTSFKAPNVWDYLSSSGYKCGVINMPQTYPPSKINGFMISGMHAFDNHDYTYPKELKKRIVSEFGYKVRSDYEILENANTKRKAYRAMIDVMRRQFLAARRLLVEENLDFLHLTIFYTDTIQHFFWKHMETQDGEFSKVIEDYWQVCDEELGKLLSVIDGHTDVILMSDHGFTSLKARFYLNDWLIQTDILRLNKGAHPLARMASKFRLDARKMEMIVERLKLKNLITGLFPTSSLRRIESTFSSKLGVDAFPDHVDWKSSKAIMIGEGLIYVTESYKSEGNQVYEDFRSDLIHRLKSIKDPRTGTHIMQDVKRGEDVYSGRFSACGPDIVAIPNEGYRTENAIRGEPWEFARAEWSACHKQDGIALATGPSISRAGEIRSVSIYDLTPTILHIFGLPIPLDMDGRVVAEIFRPDSDSGSRSVKFDRPTHRVELSRRIKKLKRS